ncbi:MAG: MlaD family protein [Bacteroidota bacterium]|nr:MlaD family protein [Bacteroidota bacterium]MDP4215628.1 MlaD family protein [Bacteroidota bacterium]MDP4245597.1 MlaD family protein [Bacteroidota bacterium]MDP4253679.1 MlaD family protein [Bacteroidota bacterium]MDP4259575.1 MlaD family protein [Bacteroidota bacterium]
MANLKISSLKLGLFVLAGLFLFILTLYIIGKNQNFFGSSFEVRARFSNVNGLIPGNNIRFAGIQAGTVKHIRVINDSSVEVVLSIDNEMKPYIHKNAVASLGTEGLMGNKVVNIVPGKSAAPLIGSGDLLATPKTVSTDEMLLTLATTNNNIAEISEGLKGTIRRINQSKALWGILDDGSLAGNIRNSLRNLSQASLHTNEMTRDLGDIVSDIKEGKGSIGSLVRDTVLSSSLARAVEKVRDAGASIDRLAGQLDETVQDIHRQVAEGKGTVHALLQDSALARKLDASMENIRAGTDAFNQDMLALQHNFLFRGYFRKLEKEKKKAAAKNETAGTH